MTLKTYDIADYTTPLPAASPFLPGTNIQYAIDSTSIGMLKTCPRLYQYTIIDGYVPHSDSVHLRFGIEFHQALQEYDLAKASGEPHTDAERQTIANLIARIADWNVDGNDKAMKYKNPTTLLQLVIDYLDHYDNDPAETYTCNNGKPAVELSFRFSLDWGPITDPCTSAPRKPNAPLAHPYILCGHLDRVVIFNDQLFVMDRKTTTSTLSDHYFRQWEPSNQMTLYTLAGKIMLHAPIRGVIIDAAQILLDKPNRFVRGWTYRTDDQLEEWLHDLRILLVNAEYYANNNYWPMNDTACDKFGGCRFREVCSKTPSIREKFLAADFNKLEPDERWNPLKPR